MDDAPQRLTTTPQAGVPGVRQLLRPARPLSPHHTVADAADRFLAEDAALLLALPVVDDGQVLGSISRHQLNGIFLRRFGREVYGPRTVGRVMNASPLVVEVATPLARAAAYVTSHMGSPLTEDFIVVDGGRYLGVGLVMDLLAALRTEVDAGAQRLVSAYRQLKASQAQLVQSEKMASLGQMVAGVAHEINTPLGYVRNNVEMMRDVYAQLGEALLDAQGLLAGSMAAEAQVFETRMAELHESRTLEDTAALFDDTLHGLDSIKELVQGLRNFSRLDQARQDEVSLHDCLEQTLVIAHNLLKARVEVVRRYGEIPRVRCSPSQINQIFLNLFANAAQAIEHDQGRLLLRTEADANWVRVHVQDNGKGIDAEHLGRIFDPFFTTKPVGQGTGLGLSISYQIAQAHGGRIDVVSHKGRGTKFVLSLPLSPPAGGTPA